MSESAAFPDEICNPTNCDGRYVRRPSPWVLFSSVIVLLGMWTGLVVQVVSYHDDLGKLSSHVEDYQAANIKQYNFLATRVDDEQHRYETTIGDMVKVLVQLQVQVGRIETKLDGMREVK